MPGPPRRTPSSSFRGSTGATWWRFALDLRVRPTVRRAAELRLIERLSGMSVGERVAIARRGSARVVQGLRGDPNPRVIHALLENPRLTEAILLPMLHDEKTPTSTLAVLADATRWVARYPVRLAICRNPRTPTSSALKLLPLLKKGDLRAVAADPRLPGAVRQRAGLLGGERRNP